MQHEILSDSKTVWINGSDGCCLGRFGRYGIDVHKTAVLQFSEGQCLTCTAGATTAEDWTQFKHEMLAHHKIEVPDTHKPKFLIRRYLMSNQGRIYRQGDVLLVAVSSKPETAVEQIERENGAIVLAHGEATGHAHAIKSKGATLFRDQKLQAIFLQVSDVPALLEHQEHTTIELPPGNYEVIRQREYSPEAIRQVQD
jgi:hypothetical protein